MNCKQMVGRSVSLIPIYSNDFSPLPTEKASVFLSPIFCQTLDSSHTNTKHITSKALNLSTSYLTGC